MNQKKRFTLVELLVVIAIIAILASMLLPALSSANQQAKLLSCKNNMKQIGMGLLIYADMANEWAPPIYWACPQTFFASSMEMAGLSRPKQMKNTMFMCPAEDKRLEVGVKNSYWGDYGQVAAPWGGEEHNVIGAPYVSWFIQALGTRLNGTGGWYGTSVASDSAVWPTPNLRFLGNTTTSSAVDSSPGGVTKTLLQPSAQPMLGEEASLETTIRNGKYNMPHMALGTNLIYMDGHADYINYSSFPSAKSCADGTGEQKRFYFK